MEVFYLFNIGDKIVYPTQGVGVIDTMGEQEFFGKSQTYYHITLLNNLKVMLPAKRLEATHIRHISDLNTLKSTLENINSFDNLLENQSKINTKERTAQNTSKIKSGTLDDYASVVYTLTMINKEHNLNSGEKQILSTAKKFLVDEISLAKGINTNEACDILENYIN